MASSIEVEQIERGKRLVHAYQRRDFRMDLAARERQMHFLRDLVVKCNQRELTIRRGNVFF